MLYEGFLGKYVADAFDGKTLWLLMDEEELRGKYQYGTQPPPGEQYSKEFESFKGTPYGEKVTVNQILTKIFG